MKELDKLEQDLRDLGEIETALLEIVTRMIDKGHRPEAVGAVLAKTTYAIYKTVLPANDYEQMAAYLYEASPSVKSFHELAVSHNRHLN
jgi:hypothetical protein